MVGHEYEIRLFRGRAGHYIWTCSCGSWGAFDFSTPEGAITSWEDHVRKEQSHAD